MTAAPASRAFTSNVMPSGDRNGAEGEKVRLRGMQTVGQRLPRLQILQERRGLRIIEIEHRRLRLATKPRKRVRSSSIDLWSSEMLLRRRHGDEQRDGAVALIDFADENLALADQALAKGEAAR